MPVLKNILFRNFDNNENPVFITYDSRTPNWNDKDNYDDLKEIIYKLKGLGYESEYPFFHNEELKFATITIEKTYFDVSFLKPGIYYHLDYTIKIKDKGGKSYINCYITPEKWSPDAPTGLAKPLGGKASDEATEEYDGEDLII